MLSRNSLKQKVLSAVEENYSDIFLDCATGAGKTHLMMCMMEKILSKSNKRILFVVPKITMINNHTQDFIKHGFEKMLNNIDMICYNSLSKQADIYSAIFCDESHNLFGKTLSESKYFKALENFNVQHRIYASATNLKYYEDFVRNSFGNKLINVQATLLDLIESGILPTPTIIVKRVYLDNTERKYSYIFRNYKTKSLKPDDVIKSKTINYHKNWKKDYYSLPKEKTNFIIKCNQQEYLDIIDDELLRLQKLSFQQGGSEYIIFQQKQLGLHRKNMFAEFKESYIKERINHLRKDNKRFVCFLPTIDQLYNYEESLSVHSKKTNKENESVIERFNNKKSDEIYSVGILKEGFNLFDIDAGIIAQLNNPSTHSGKAYTKVKNNQDDLINGDLIQQIGRVMRSEHPVVYIYCFANTKDEEITKLSLKPLTNYILWD
jgi:superfamily II DNA or RNA helicase